MLAMSVATHQRRGRYGEAHCGGRVVGEVGGGDGEEGLERVGCEDGWFVGEVVVVVVWAIGG
jgi:hypothetical protein